MPQFFQPDYLFDDIAAIPADLPARLGIRLLICDIDNTLVTYDDPTPTAPVLAFFDALRKNGVQIAFLSNNKKERVERFNESLGYQAVSGSGKPFAYLNIRRIRRAAGVTRDESAMLGDQIFTDVLAARFARIPAILVKPIKDKKTKFFRFKRSLEKPFLQNFRAKYGENSQKKLRALRREKKRAARKERRARK